MEDSAENKKNIQNSKENRKKCACPYCPSYPHECSGDIMFCATGKSRCDIGAAGCICNTCPIYFEYELKGSYYCNKDKVGINKIPMRKKGSDEDDSFYHSIVNIKEMAETGSSTISSMGSLKKMPFSLNDLHFLPAQVSKIPLNLEEEVNTHVTIGPQSKKPFRVNGPLMISGMSFGAVSRNVRMVIAETAKKLNIGFNSGEGGILQEEREIAAERMIVQFSTGRYGITQEVLKKSSAVEIRFGQGAYPGKGSFLPADKITKKIAEIRGIEKGQASYSPASHFDMRNGEDIENKVNELRSITGGVPIGAKIGCGNVEKDLEILIDSKVDFIALDGFGGATGATDHYVKENVGIPITAALPRAHEYLDQLGVRDEISLIASGKLLNSPDFAKCLALGADAIYLGTAALIAIGCEQYRICYTGMCPTGITTQNPQLMKQLDIDEGVRKLINFINTSNNEIANLCRIVGKKDVNSLDKDDLVSMDKSLSSITGVKWVNGQ